MRVIKNLLTITLVLLLGLTASTVNASSNINWYSETFEGSGDVNAYNIVLDVVIPSDALGVTIDIPYDENFTLDHTESVYSGFTSSTYSTFEFYNGSTLLQRVNIEDLKADFPEQFDGVLLAGEYQFNFSDLINQYSLSDDINFIKVTILTNYYKDDVPEILQPYKTSVLEANAETITNLLSQYNSEGRVTFSYYDYSLDLGESDFDLTWESYNTFGDNYIIRDTITLSAPVDTLTLYIPPSRYHSEEESGTYPYITLYDDILEILSVDLRNIGLGTYSELVIIDLKELALNYGFTYSDIDSIFIGIPQNYSTTPSGYVDYLDDNTIAVADANLRVVYYMTDGNAIYKSAFINIPPVYEGYKIGHTFINWSIADGSFYDYTVVTDDMLVNGIFYLYGNYVAVSGVDYDPEEPTADDSTGISTVLARFNFDNTFGYVLIYIILLLLVIVSLLKINAPSIMIAIAIILITGLFIYLGWLPLIISTIAIFVIIFILYLSFGE